MMTETAVRKVGVRRGIGLGIVVLAAALTVGLSHLYPPSLTGEWDHPADANSHSPLLLTLRPGGSGYIKASNLPEETLRWYADGDRVNLLVGSGYAASYLQTSHPIARRRAEDQTLLLDAGGTILRMQRTP